MDFGSINEENVYRALEKLGMQFDYQYTLNGGRRVRGGQVIDFVVWIPPQPVAINVQGSYWHGRGHEQEDMLKQGDQVKAGFRVVNIQEAECETVEGALEALRKYLL